MKSLVTPPEAIINRSIAVRFIKSEIVSGGFVSVIKLAKIFLRNSRKVSNFSKDMSG